MDLRAKLEQLERKNAVLEKRVQELNLICEDLQDICAAKGVHYKEALSVRQHSRLFAQSYREHPLEATAVASEVFAMVPIVHLLAEMSSSLLSFSQVSRGFLSALQELPAQSRWRTGIVRRVATLIGHAQTVCALAELDRGLLARASGDKNVKVWNVW